MARTIKRVGGKRKTKRKLNGFFIAMNKAKKSKADSFMYKGKKYTKKVDKNRPKMIFYKKA